MEIGRGSSAAGDSCCDRTFKFLQVLYIPLCALSLQMGFLFPGSEILSQFDMKTLVGV